MIEIGGRLLHVLLCYPFLDFRFLTEWAQAPRPPSWPYGNFKTVGSLGAVVAVAEGGHEAEIRANAAVLFPSERRRKRGVRPRQSALELENGISVAGRRLLADTDGHVRVEITLGVASGLAGSLTEILESLLQLEVDVVRFGRVELISAGFRLAQAYLHHSAKTAEPTNFQLLDKLLREGAGSPFIIVLRADRTQDETEGVLLEPARSDFGATTCSLATLAGHTLGVWQIWDAGPTGKWLPAARSLCRIICHLSEVTLLAGLQQDANALVPYLLSQPAADSFLRLRAGQLRRKSYGGWPVLAVNALAAQHLRVSIDEQANFQEGLYKIARRDAANDIVKSIDRIKAEGANVQLNFIGTLNAREVVVGGDQAGGNIVKNNQSAGDIAAGDITKQTAGGDIVGGDKTIEQALAPVASVIAAAPAETRAAAEQELAGLKAEVAKGDKANDEAVGGFIEKLVELVPEGVSALATAFAGPLGAVAGPITKFVLKKLQGKK